jgi:hypothetical protein
MKSENKNREVRHLSCGEDSARPISIDPKYIIIHSAMSRLENVTTRLLNSIDELKGMKGDNPQPERLCTCFKEVYDGLPQRANQMADTIDSINEEINSLLSN